MTYIHRHAIAITTNTTSGCTVYSPGVANGRVLCVQLATDTIVLAALKLVLTGEETGIVIMAATTAYFATRRSIVPQIMTCIATTGATATSRGTPVISEERLQLVVTNGGATVAGTLYVYTG